MSSTKSSFVMRITSPSVSIFTVALRRESATSASSPKVSPGPSSASRMDSPEELRRATSQRPRWIT